MLKNLQIEWMKIKNYRVFQVFSVLYMLGILLIIYIFYKFYITAVGSFTGKEGDTLNLFTPENIFGTVCFWTSLLLYLPGMVIITLFINEVSYKTHRQNIIDGWKRETFIYSKIGLIVCMSLVITLMNFIAVMVMAAITHTSINVAAVSVLAYAFVQTLVYLLFALLLATFFRRSGVAIIVYFVYGLLLEFLFMWLLSNISASAKWFLPLEIGDALIPFPFLKSNFYTGLPSQPVLLVGAFAFIGLYIFLAVRKYKYDDL